MKDKNFYKKKYSDGKDNEEFPERRRQMKRHKKHKGKDISHFDSETDLDDWYE